MCDEKYSHGAKFFHGRYFAQSQNFSGGRAYGGTAAFGRPVEHRATRPALRWFWSITMIGARHKGIRTDGCTPTLKQAKAELQANWHKWLVIG